jgi:hypothetical protein
MRTELARPITRTRAQSRRLRNDPELQLRFEEVYDRRWARHRDQLLTVIGISAAIAGIACGVPALTPLALLPAGPRAVQWISAQLATEKDG